MSDSKYRRRLPQLGATRLLTHGGIETSLIFHDGFDLPQFAAFTLLASDEGRAALRRSYERYVQVARDQGVGFVLDSPTWRASRDWGEKLGYDALALAEANQAAAAMMHELRAAFEAEQPFVVSGNMGPRGDGYAPGALLTPAESEEYHREQAAALDAAGVDMISAVTITHAGEAAGIARACARRDLPLALGFTLETDGRLPSGQTLGEAIREVDADPSGGPSYYMITCAHPDHFRAILDPDADWTRRIRGLRANASRKSHAELDEAETLDDGDPAALAQDYAALLPLLPNLRVFGACCGADHRHVREIGAVCAPAAAA